MTPSRLNTIFYLSNNRCWHYLFTTSAEPLQTQTMGLPQEEDSDSQNEADVVSLSSASGSALHDPPPAKDAEKETRNKIINLEEQTSLRNARAVVIVGGIACAAAVAVAINIFAHQNEQSSFELEVRKTESSMLICLCHVKK
jgi:hypothetical protein